MRQPFEQRQERRGNFSYANRHPVVYSIREYPIEIINGIAIVGKRTPLEILVTQGVADFITNCQYFEELRLKSFVEHDGKQYPATYTISKCHFLPHFATFQVIINTNQEFIYEFQEL